MESLINFVIYLIGLMHDFLSYDVEEAMSLSSDKIIIQRSIAGLDRRPVLPYLISCDAHGLYIFSGAPD